MARTGSRRSTWTLLLIAFPVWLGGVAFAADEGSAGSLTCPPCDDGNICTADLCDASAGFCRFEPLVCDDGNPCTIENQFCCPDPFVCGFNACEVYDVEPAGTACDDGNPCTSESVCDGAGRCAGTPLPADSACDDGDSCTDGEVCMEGASSGIACVGTARGCDDGNACTSDACEPESGVCEHQALNCNDRNVCTADSCDPQRGCVHVPVDGGCDFGSPCSDPDYCSGGNCFPGPVCGTQSPCLSGFCNGNRCSYVPANEGTVCGGTPCIAAICVRGDCEGGFSVDCDDGDPLTDDSCDPEVGCVHRAACDDGNSCTTDSRHPLTGECAHLAFEGACEDGNACTIGEACSEGVCQPGGAVDCDDANGCTDDSCNPASGCVHVANSLGCDDGDACTRGDVCREGQCTGGSVTCDDGNVCTLDACDPAFGCLSIPDPGLPDSDGDATPDRCDNCPTLANPDQDPAACEQSVVNIVVGGRRGRSSIDGALHWSTTHELDVRGFNVIEVEADGVFRTLNGSLIPCSECTTGAGAAYTLRLRGLGRRRGDIFVDLVRLDGRTERFGPAVEP